MLIISFLGQKEEKPCLKILKQNVKNVISVKEMRLMFKMQQQTAYNNVWPDTAEFRLYPN